ncbi:MAG: hypothetical protein OXC01_13850 [Immundisolibacterales bacterium]|nr:hypothetical protein [Immundisolibacterales bacterium]
MQDLLELVNAALRARRWSARQASIEAVGNDQLIRNMRRGQVPSVEKFRRLCEVLGLEFYAGPPREVGTVEAERLKHAIETTELLLKEQYLELEPGDKATVVAAVYDLIGQERSHANVARIRQLITGIAAGTRGDRRR